jgi:hypothetical protein
MGRFRPEVVALFFAIAVPTFGVVAFFLFHGTGCI